MITNTSVTLYNSYYNKETQLNEWRRTLISLANWQGSHKSSVSDKGLNNNDYANIYIPLTSNFIDKTYINPKEYARLSKDLVDHYFTFSIGDKIVKGSIEFEVTGVKPNTIAYLEQVYDDVLTIMSVNKHDYVKSMAHYHIGAQ